MQVEATVDQNLRSTEVKCRLTTSEVFVVSGAEKFTLIYSMERSVPALTARQACLTCLARRKR